MIRFIAPLAAAGCILALITGFLGLVKGRSEARYYTLAWAMFLVGGIALALTNLGFLASNPFTEKAADVGSVVEVLLLFCACGKNQPRAKPPTRGLTKALELKVTHTEELEHRVLERTEALEEVYAQLQVLSDTVQLTGIKIVAT